MEVLAAAPFEDQRRIAATLKRLTPEDAGISTHLADMTERVRYDAARDRIIIRGPSSANAAFAPHCMGAPPRTDHHVTVCNHTQPDRPHLHHHAPASASGTSGSSSRSSNKRKSSGAIAAARRSSSGCAAPKSPAAAPYAARAAAAAAAAASSSSGASGGTLPPLSPPPDTSGSAPRYTDAEVLAAAAKMGLTLGEARALLEMTDGPEDDQDCKRPRPDAPAAVPAPARRPAPLQLPAGLKQPAPVLPPPASPPRPRKTVITALPTSLTNLAPSVATAPAPAPGPARDAAAATADLIRAFFEARGGVEQVKLLAELAALQGQVGVAPSTPKVATSAPILAAASAPPAPVSPPPCRSFPPEGLLALAAPVHRGSSSAAAAARAHLHHVARVVERGAPREAHGGPQRGAGADHLMQLHLRPQQRQQQPAAPALTQGAGLGGRAATGLVPEGNTMQVLEALSFLSAYAAPVQLLGLPASDCGSAHSIRL